MLKVDVQFVPLNLRLNLHCDYYCESLSLTPAGPTFANSDGEVIKVHSQLPTNGKYIYLIEEGGARLGFQIEADTSHLLAMIAVGPKKPLTFHSYATGTKGTKVPDGHYLFQTMRPFDTFQCIPNVLR